ncbi:MAG: YceI family protein, partial [Planctomycetota bacterium]|nr:YceI family protein [Planctomycetota bacterium]
GRISLPVASIDTGIPMRNDHMQSPGWLDAKNNPSITFEIEGSKNVKVISEGSDHLTYDMQLVGTFSVHGKSKTIEVPARLTYMAESAMTKNKGPGDLLAGRATFSIKLSDYGVTGPQGMKIMGLKVSDTLSISITFVATTEKPKMANPCNPCGGKKK